MKKMKKRFEIENFIAFARFYADTTDGFLMIFKERERLVALSPLTGRVFPVIQRGSGFYALLPLPDGKQYAAPLKLSLT